MSNSINRRDFLIATGLGAAALPLGACASPADTPRTTDTPFDPHIRPVIPKTTVRFGNGIALDHSAAVIGMEQGWFAALGITIEPAPYGTAVPNDQRAAILSAGAADVIDAGDYALVPMLKQLPNLRAFTYFDVFLGNAAVIQPDSPLKTHAELVADGVSPADTVSMAAAQLRGKRWAYLAGAYTKQFVDIVLAKGGLHEDDVELIPVADNNVVDLMLSKHADVSTTSAQARVTLENKGFKVLLPFDEMYKSAEPTPTSPELRAVNLAGWVTTKEFAEANHDLLLRLFGLQYRITDMIRNRAEPALVTQVPYLNRIAGSSITTADAAVLYERIHPVLTIDDLDRIVNDKNDPLYYEWQLGAKIAGYVEQGLYQKGELKPADISLVPALHKEMIDLRARAEADIEATEKLVGTPGGSNGVKTALAEAKQHLTHFNYLDAFRFAAHARTTAEKK
jgi:ABC-type nitrate/sulfonate/bicarbonate transport system substrate-binding protein